MSGCNSILKKLPSRIGCFDDDSLKISRGEPENIREGESIIHSYLPSSFKKSFQKSTQIVSRHGETIFITYCPFVLKHKSNAELRRFTEGLRCLNVGLRCLNAELRRFTERLRRFTEGLRQFTEGLRQFTERLRQFTEGLRQFTERLRRLNAATLFLNSFLMSNNNTASKNNTFYNSHNYYPYNSYQSDPKTKPLFLRNNAENNYCNSLLID